MEREIAHLNPDNKWIFAGRPGLYGQFFRGTMPKLAGLDASCQLGLSSVYSLTKLTLPSEPFAGHTHHW